jgi:hypothetical protein
MGMRVQRLPGVIYHVFHERGPDSRPDNPYIQSNAQEVQRIKHLKIAELRAQVKSWSWVQERTPVKVLLWNDTWEADDQLLIYLMARLRLFTIAHRLTNVRSLSFAPPRLTLRVV